MQNKIPFKERDFIFENDVLNSHFYFTKLLSK